MYKENDYMQMAEELITCDKLGILQKNIDKFAMFEEFKGGHQKSSFFVSGLGESPDENLMVFTLQEYDDFMFETAGIVKNIALSSNPKERNRIYAFKRYVSDNIRQMLENRRVKS